MRAAVEAAVLGVRAGAATQLVTEPGPGYIWPNWDGPEKLQPRSYAEVDAMFDVPGGHHKVEDKHWVAANIIECHGDGKHPRLPGVPAKWYFHTHWRIEPYWREALRRALISAPEYTIERFGGYVWRTIRHEANAPLSPHGRGIAGDVDPDRNRGIQFRKGKAPKLWSPEWYEVWPHGVTPPFVQAFLSCGFRWGSDWDEDSHSEDHDWQDPMHFEWVAGDGVRTAV